jgi:hypothetical protein
MTRISRRRFVTTPAASNPARWYREANASNGAGLPA